MKVLAAIVILAMFVDKGESLKCHKCNGVDCTGLETCDKADSGASARGNSSFVCEKKVTAGSTVRSCFPKASSHQDDGCTVIGSSTTCYCNTDGCNNAFGGKMYLKMMMPFLVVCYFTARMLAI